MAPEGRQDVSVHLATDLRTIAGNFGAMQWIVVDRSIGSDTWTTPEGEVQRVTAPIALDGSVCATFVVDDPTTAHQQQTPRQPETRSVTPPHE